MSVNHSWNDFKMFPLINNDNQLASLGASVDRIRLNPPERVSSDPAHGRKVLPSRQSCSACELCLS